jgi:hypothetical protein
VKIAWQGDDTDQGGNMNRIWTRAGAAAAGLALTFAAAAAVADLGGNEKTQCAGNICITDDGGIAPTKLPRRGKAPITARLYGEIATRDGTHPPPVETLEIEIDKSIGLDAVGLPTCKLAQLQSRNTADAKRACGSATVGSGSAEVEVEFPEQAPFRSTGPVLLFNGGVRGRTTTSSSTPTSTCRRRPRSSPRSRSRASAVAASASGSRPRSQGSPAAPAR